LKKILFNIVLTVLFALVMILIIIKFEDPGMLQNTWALINYNYLVVACVFMVIYWLFDGVLLYNMVGIMSYKLSYRNSFNITMSVQFFNAITPFASGGQPAMVYLLSKKGITYGESTALVVLKSIIFQASLFVVTIFSIIFNYRFFIRNITGFIPLFLIGSLTNIGVILFYCMFFNKFLMSKIMNGLCNLICKIGFKKQIDKFRDNVNKEIEVMGTAMHTIRKNKRRITRFVFISVIKITVLCSILYFLQLACEPVKASYINMLTSQYMVTMITSLVPSPGAAGGAEGVGYVFFNVFFKTSSVLAVVFLWRLITYYSNLLIGGIFCLLNKDRPLKQEPS